jgi:anti-sigma factor ChrR (cupin superfamily)
MLRLEIPRQWARLFRFQPGVEVPRYGHVGKGYSLVLEGSYVEGGERFAAGDFSEADSSVRRVQEVDSEVPVLHS